MKKRTEEELDRCKTCGHARYQHDKGCGGPGVPPAVVCLCQGFDGPPLSISLEAEVRRLRAEVERLTREREALLAPKSARDRMFDSEAWDGAMDALGKMRERAERAEAERDAALREKDRLTREYEEATGKRPPIASCGGNPSWHIAIVQERDNLRSRLEEARALLSRVVASLGAWEERHTMRNSDELKKARAWLSASDPKEGARNG